MNKYICPYCKANRSKKVVFKSWTSVVTHTNYCDKNNKEYVIHKDLGPVHYTELLNKPIEELKSKYGHSKLRDMQQRFKKFGYIEGNFYKKYTKLDVIEAIQNKAEELGRTPTNFDFRKTSGNYPSIGFITKEFGSWLKALEASGFKPNTSDLYGKPTVALDNHLYRSRAEAFFVDKYLYDRFYYIIEPIYKNYDLLYDWYVPVFDLYIELDGGVRSGIIQEKIEINNKQNTNCIYIPYKEIYKVSNRYLEDFIRQKERYIETYSTQ